MRILKTLTIIALYELSKYITEQVIIRLQANDDVDAPRDFSIYDHIHLNEVSKQCSG
ncbi:transcriptional regulator [Staphylococcus gallinarum]|uniref:transcriptional activator RinB n=2 Tax=Staphylococcus gallinarum TaxID=1293 RepID=UPI000E68AD6B|nr:transcriptional regulator [Staphylococcus gallinarum]RIL33037.1 transcriptional regulator [Staphylococcus gallinarum]